MAKKPIRAEAFVDLARHEARRIHRRTQGAVELDELLSMGVEGLLEAVERFEPDRNVPFAAYARTRIRGRILDSLGHTAALPRRAFRHARRHGSRITHIPLSASALDRVPHLNGPPERLRVEMAGAVDACRAKRALVLLPEQSAELLRMLFLEGRTLVEAAQILAISPSWASRLRDRALLALRGLLAAVNETPQPLASAA